MPENSPLGGRLPAHANLENLKKQAKSLLRSVRASDPEAVRRVEAIFPTKLDLKSIKLNNTQFVVACEYGFASWPKLKAALDGTPGPSIQDVVGLLNGPREVPLIPLRDVVLFPGWTIPIFIGREKTKNALMAALPDKPIIACTQRDVRTEEIGETDIYRLGTLVTPVQWSRFVDGTIKAVVKVGQTAQVESVDFSGDYIKAKVSPIPDGSNETDPDKVGSFRALLTRLSIGFDHPRALATAIEEAESWNQLAILAFAYFDLSVEDRQRLLEIAEPAQQLDSALNEFARIESALNGIQLDDYVGSYQLSPDYLVDVSLKENRLIVRTPWDRHTLRPRTGDAFTPMMEFPDEPQHRTEPLPEAMGKARSPVHYQFLRNDLDEISSFIRTDDTGIWPTVRRYDPDKELETATGVSLKLLQQYVGRYEEVGRQYGVALGLVPGKYEAELSDMHSITVKDGSLVYDDLKLIPITNTDFMGRDKALRILFKVNDAGSVVGMRAMIPGDTSQLYKMD